MSFDWLTFFDRYRIEFRDHGPNVGKDHVVVRCPFCNDDPGMHLSISLEGKGWRCFRDHNHAGISPVRLIQSLARVDWQTAAAIGGRDVQQYVQPTSILEHVNNLLSPAKQQLTVMEFPPTARPLDDRMPSARPYQQYMKRRGFTEQHLASLADWDVLYDSRDQRWHGRILFGTRYQGQLVAMTGRAVGNRSEPRYLAAGDASLALIWAHLMPKDGRLLVLTEGPFDALKINMLGNPSGIWATCAFTSSFSPQLRSRLFELIPSFERTVVLFDNGNEANAYRLTAGLPARIDVATLPFYANDPAELRSVDWLLEEVVS